MIWQLLLAVGLLCSSTPVHAEENMEKATLYSGWGFTVEIPQQIQVSKENPVEDFDLYTFSGEHGKNILQAYAGNHPKFPKNHPANVQLEITRIGELMARTMAWSNAEGRRYRETLVELPQKMDVPGAIHFWYEDLSPSDSVLADKIISAIKN
jgi:hypothetical protein